MARKLFTLFGLVHVAALSCQNDIDCALNGQCVLGVCECDLPWTGPACGQLKFIPNEAPSAAYGYNPNVTSWGGNVVHGDDGMYHLFVTEIAGDGCGLREWHHNSQVVHAVARDPDGPYLRQNVALPPSAHNPHIVRFNGEWLIFHIYPALNGTINDCDSGFGQFHQSKEGAQAPLSSNIHRSTSLDGPWSPVNSSMPECTNPSPWVLPNGTLACVCTPGPGGNFTLLTTEQIDGEWTEREIWPGVSPPEIRPHKFWEDPFLWVDTNGYWHVLMHTYSPHQMEDADYISGHIFSLDGLEWHTHETEPYRHDVWFSDGSSRNYSTIERPKMLFDEQGRPTHLFNGVSSYWQSGCKVCGGCTACKINAGTDWTYTLVRQLATADVDVTCKTAADCSLNGQCHAGRCECRDPWMGEKCSQMNFVPPASPSAAGAYGFHPNVTSWGGNVVQSDDGVYHLFVTEIAGAECGLAAWKHNSMVVHATAKSPQGPYERSDVALPILSHNPHIIRFHDEWLIFHIYPALNGTAQPCTALHGGRLREESGVRKSVGIHRSTSLYGPWSQVDMEAVPECVNPAPWVLSNGTLVVACSGKNFTLLTTESIDGQWMSRDIWPGVSPPEIWPHKFWEDPVLWVDSEGYWHILAHTYSPHQNEDRDYISGHLFSYDGLTWTTNNIEPYRHEVRYADGSGQNFSTIERPKFLFDAKGQPTHLFNGVSSYWPDGCGACGGCTECKVTHGTDWTYTMVRELKQTALAWV